MNKIGDIIKGNTIGKNSKEWFVWTVCPNCGRGRWVRKGKAQLQKYTGWCQSCVAKRNNKIGVGKDAAAWKGGYTKEKGYILLLLQPDDFFFPMTKHDGYVREHRLVMAKHLNRCLLPWEVVHHKGIKYLPGSIENRSDNRIENLELLPSNTRHNTQVERVIKQKEGEAWQTGYGEGYQEGEKTGLEQKCLETYEMGHKDGTKKVVDWVKENSHDLSLLSSSASGIGIPDTWFAQLKSWGIKED